MKILVVDDSLLNLKLAEKILKHHEKIDEIILCEEPKKALNIIDEMNIDILLLDVVMPELDGFDILKILRSQEDKKDLVIIMFTSLSDKESFKKCFELGASDYISKPINEDEFNARIKAALNVKENFNTMKHLISITQNQNKELSEMNIKLKDTQFHLIQADKMAAIGQLSAGIAHEINNPMGYVKSNIEILNKYYTRIVQYLDFLEASTSEGILTFSEFVVKNQEMFRSLKMKTVKEELDDILKETKSGIDRVAEIVQSLRSFARTVKDDEKDSYNLKDIIDQVILITRNEVKYVANLTVNIPEEIEIYVNKVQIGQVLINLIVNAAQAIKSQDQEGMGSISVSAERDEEHVYIYVSDDGPGISKEIQTKIFDPFFTTKDIGKGTGLGLSISYDIIVNKHDGQINVNSEMGKGATFILQLPIKLAIND